MQIKIFTLRFSDATEAFDDAPLRSFMADKEVISLKGHFFVRDNVPYWAVLLVYKPSPMPAEPKAEKRENREKKEDYRDILTEEKTPLFNTLRDWRNERARREGVPPYVLFTNRQLAGIAVKTPEHLNQLSMVEGVGKTKIEKYGKDILATVASVKTGQPPPQTVHKPPSPTETKDSLFQNPSANQTPADKDPRNNNGT